jgi:Second Messenger Oligonucleotide or Dinucleotide Synthetase domain
LWIHVIPHFDQFLTELELTSVERKDADGKAERVARCLWNYYYPGDFNPGCYVKVGSYGKGTACRPQSDLDLAFVLPWEVYTRIDRLQGNKQSQLLQEIKRVLLGAFPNTDLAADGQVVMAPFSTYEIEVLPAFRFNDGRFLIANTNDGGSWRISNPVAEYEDIKISDALSNGKATDLLRMMKAWKRECSVEIKSICLEVLVCVFVKEWIYRDKTHFYYDWMIRDCFAFLASYVNGWTRAAGSQEQINLGDCWATKRESAYNRALKACEYEHLDCGYLAAEEWQKIFGYQFRNVRTLSALVSA